VSEKLGWMDDEGEGRAPSSYTQMDEDEDEDESIGRGRGTVVAVDLLPMLPIPGVHFLQMDFLHPSSAPRLISVLPEGNADVVLSDMAPNMSGNKVRDEERGREISEAVWEFSRRVLSTDRGGGTLLYVLYFLALTAPVHY
jgi:23S rRNA (uridine2552-2'-O)-methyltransferase